MCIRNVVVWFSVFSLLVVSAGCVSQPNTSMYKDYLDFESSIRLRQILKRVDELPFESNIGAGSRKSRLTVVYSSGYSSDIVCVVRDGGILTIKISSDNVKEHRYVSRSRSGGHTIVFDESFLVDYKTLNDFDARCNSFLLSVPPGFPDSAYVKLSELGNASIFFESNVHGEVKAFRFGSMVRRPFPKRHQDTLAEFFPSVNSAQLIECLDNFSNLLMWYREQTKLDI